MPRVQFRRDLKTQWETYNPILADGEIGIESDSKRFKLGDGINNWTSLSYSSKALADEPQQYVGNLDITDITYAADGSVSEITYQGGHKTIFTYIGTDIDTIEYTDTDGTSVLITETYTYTNGKLTALTRT